jgi:hypothetical protein
MEKEQQDIRFGIIAVNKGFVTPEQVVKAFETQLAEDLSKGGHKPIGQILLDRELITRAQLDEILQDLKQAV